MSGLLDSLLCGAPGSPAAGSGDSLVWVDPTAWDSPPEADARTRSMQHPPCALPDAPRCHWYARCEVQPVACERFYDWVQQGTHPDGATAGSRYPPSHYWYDLVFCADDEADKLLSP